MWRSGGYSEKVKLLSWHFKTVSAAHFFNNFCVDVNRLSGLRDLVRGRQLLEVILKLLGFCVKVKVWCL